MNKLISLLMCMAAVVVLSSASSCGDASTPESNVETSNHPPAGSNPQASRTENQDLPDTSPVASVSKASKRDWSKVKEKAMQDGRVIISTTFGEMEVKLYDETPLHKENFMKLAYEGFYDELLFHRVIQGFMVQGGDPDSRGAAAGVGLGMGGPGYTIDAEIKTGLVHKKGALAAARRGSGNPLKKSSGSQFYIVHGKPTQRQQLEAMSAQKNAQLPEGQKVVYTEAQMKAFETQGGTPFLDGDYTVFGEVINGLEIIDKIAAVKTAKGDRPLEDVKMKITVPSVE